MKLTLTFLWMTFGAILMFGQLPEWTDFNQRQKLFPTDQYLIGYSQESGVKKDDLQISYEYIEQLARGELIESVQVLVNSVSTSEIADYDGDNTDFFKNETVSSSSANLVGLKTDRYYDKKKKTTHILVYVKRRELVEYYLSLVSKHVGNIRQMVSSGDKAFGDNDYKKAFQAYYGTKQIFLSIDESQTYLLALGERNSLRLKVEEVNELKSLIQGTLTKLRTNDKKNLDDVSFFISYALSKSTIKTKDSVQVKQFSYQETGLASKLSYRLQQNIIQDMAANSNYSLQKHETESARFYVKGTYWEKQEMLLFKTELYDSKKKTSISSFSTLLAKKNISSTITYLSPDIINIRQIPLIQVASINQKLSGKVGFAIKYDLKVKVKIKNENGLLTGGYNIPIRFLDREHDINYGTSWTDNYGNAKFKINRIKNSSRNQVIVAELDLDNYLSVGKDNKYLSKVLRNSEIPSTNFYLTIKESLVYFDVREKNFGRPLGVPIVEPGLKKYLSDAGYKFTDDESKADLIVTINSDTRKGGEISGIYFSYVDVNVSIRESQSKKEIFKKSFNGYKGAGGSFEQAGAKSYNAATKEICPLVYQLMTQ
jgi:hypothetical protein